MQTRQKVITRTTDKETNQKLTRHQRKTTFSTENKITELITSSGRKTKNAIAPKKNRNVEAAKPLKAISLHDGHQNMNDVNGVSLNHRQTDMRGDLCTSDTIFSPAFHVTKDSHDITPDHGSAEVGVSKNKAKCQESKVGDSEVGSFCSLVATQKQSENPLCNRSLDDDPSTCPIVSSRPSEGSNMHNVYGAMVLNKATAHTSYHEECVVTGDLSPEVSAIYLAMQSSKLECVDEPCQDSVSTDDYGYR